MKNKFNYKKMPFENKEAAKFFVLRAMSHLVGNEMVVSYDDVKKDSKTRQSYRNYRIYFKAYEDNVKNANGDMQLASVDAASNTCDYDSLAFALDELMCIRKRNLWQRIFNKD